MGKIFLYRLYRLDRRFFCSKLCFYRAKVYCQNYLEGPALVRRVIRRVLPFAQKRKGQLTGGDPAIYSEKEG